MDTAASTRAVFDRFLELAGSGKFRPIADLYAADAIVEMPFAPPGVPKRSGRPELVMRLEAMDRDRPLAVERLDPVAVHETADPEMIVAEYDIHAVVTRTNRPVVLSFVTVMTVRDSLIVHARDYSNPLAQAEVFGG
jgi:ketosteroid isomerase-like protein